MTDNTEGKPMRWNELRTKNALKFYGSLIFLPIIIIPLMIIIGLHFNKKQDQQLLAMQFNGKVDSIWYDQGKDGKIITEPYVAVHGKTYHLYYHFWGFGHDILPGDSIIKLKDSLTVTLIKVNGKRLVFKGD